MPEQSPAPAPKVRHMTPVQYPGNDREFIIDQLFWGEDDSHWERVPGPGCTDLRRTGGYARSCTWRSAGAGSRLTWRGRIEADLVGCRALSIRAQAAAADRVTLRAEVDGAWVTVCHEQPGVDNYGEFAGPVDGRRLTGLEVVFDATVPGVETHSVMWVMLVKAGTPTPLPKPDPAWPGLLRPDAAGEPEPLLGLLFDRAALTDIRQFVRTPQICAQWQAAVRQAEACMAVVPEDTAHPIIPYATSHYGRPGTPEKAPFADAENLAFVGLVEERPDLLRQAARWALTWSRCERWVQFGCECLRGIPMSHGRFAQSSATITVARILDWCGSVLTPAGQAELARAIHDLGLVDIDGIMHPGSYVWGMNQGIVFEAGRFTGALAVRRWYPEEFARRLADARKMRDVCLNASFLEDGSGTEGPAYWNYTMLLAVPLIQALARASGQALVAETPPVIAESAAWAWHNLRTDSAVPRFITHADGGYERAIAPTVAAFLAGPLARREWETVARAQLAERAEPLFLALMQPLLARQPAPTVKPPPLKLFPAAGQVDIRPLPGTDGMRIYFFSGTRQGHCHDDKNSFLLEAYGTALLLDRATTVYTHPAITVCKSTEAHNTVCPDGQSQNVPDRQGGAILRRAEERDGVVHLESDATGCWPGLATRVLRRLTHRRPGLLLVEDDAEWVKPVQTWQCWQAPAPWTETSVGWLLTVDGVQLLLTLREAVGATVDAAPYSIDGLLRPVHRLVIRSPRAATARLVTLIRVRPSANAPWPEA